METTKVLLAGATGYLGKFIASQLLDQGYFNRLIVRDKNTASFDPQKFEIIEAQLTQPNTLNGIFKDIDIVISTVGITGQKDGLTYMDVDFRANMNLLDQAKKNGVKKFIYVSAFNGEKLKHLKMIAAKELFVEQLEKSGIDYCIIRPNGFFSDMTEFLKMAQKGTVQLFGKGDFKMNPIHGYDLAKVCVDAIHSKEKNINIGGPEIFTHNNIAKLAFNTINRDTKIKYVPDWIRRMILWTIRTFTPLKIYGTIEFFMTVLAMDMVAPKYGTQSLETFFKENYSV